MSEETLEIVIKKDVKFVEPVAVEGFPDVGLAGAIASTHLIEALGLEEIALVAQLFLKYPPWGCSGTNIVTQPNPLLQR